MYLLNDDDIIRVDVQFQGKTQHQEMKVKDLLEGNENTKNFSFGQYIFNFTPKLSNNPNGLETITATVNPKQSIHKENYDNNIYSIQTSIKPTKPLKIIFIRIARPDDYGSVSLDSYYKTVKGSEIFIRATYPVEDGNLQIITTDEVIQGNQQNNLLPLWLRMGFI